MSFKLNAHCPESISKGKEYSRLLCVKGANASGKTNVLKALFVVSDFCSNSFKLDPDEGLNFQSFFNNTKPCEFMVEFSIDDDTYTYELEVTNEEVKVEKLYRKKSAKGSRKSRLFERKGNKIVSVSNDFKFLKKITIRNNASVISTALQYEPEKFRAIHSNFSSTKSNVTLFGLQDIKVSYHKITEYFSQNKKYLTWVTEILKKVDGDIDSIEIHEREDDNGEKIHFPIFNYRTEEGSKWLTFHNLSSGTKSLYLQLSEYKSMLDRGGVLILDEFDINLHPHILPLLINLFEDDKSNPLNTQLLFTTHNSEILNQMSKYRSILVNKENSESYAYRLDELPGDILRNDRPISSLYDDGKIGGVPIV